MNAKMIAAYTGALTALAAVLITVESWLAQNDLGTPAVDHWLKALAAGIVPIGGAVGVAYAALSQLRITYVNAGLNLAASGNMLDAHGNPVTTVGAGTIPPMPATAESASKIVADYGTAAATTKP